jgi:hypothetical protein
MSSFTVREKLLAGSGVAVLAALIGAATTAPVAAQQTPPVLSASTSAPKEKLSQPISLNHIAQQCMRLNGPCALGDANSPPCCPGLICAPPQAANGRCVPGRS